MLDACQADGGGHRDGFGGGPARLVRQRCDVDAGRESEGGATDERLHGTASVPSGTKANALSVSVRQRCRAPVPPEPDILCCKTVVQSLAPFVLGVMPVSLQGNSFEVQQRAPA